MKQKLSLLTTAAVLAAASQANAQGLNAIGYNADHDFARKMPFSWYVGAQIGWDSNPQSRSTNEEDSLYVSATIGLDYNTGDRRTAWSVSASYSPLWYLDSPSGMDDFQNNARLSFNIRHRVNQRLVLTDSAYLAYEVEPNYSIGATTSRRTDPYFYWYNSLSAAYSWNRRFSTATSYTISGVSYDSDAESGEDYITHTLANEFRYAWSRTTTLALTYRFALADYDNGIGDYTSHYILVGADHRFSPRLTGSFRTGVEFRDRDSGESNSDPYFESSLVYLVTRKTDARMYARIGFQDSDIGDYGDRYGYRVGATVNHRFTTRFSGNAGLHYIRDEFSEGSSQSFDEDVVSLSLGFNYALYKNISLNGGYSYSTTSNNGSNAVSFREYDRHNVQLGVSARF